MNALIGWLLGRRYIVANNYYRSDVGLFLAWRAAEQHAVQTNALMGRQVYRIQRVGRGDPMPVTYFEYVAAL